MMIVVGATIGSGVFLKPNVVAAATQGHLGLILGLWIACGIVNLCGALALAELATMMPQAGGMYVYLREAYGPRWAFLWGWAEFWVIRTGSIAALAVGMTISIEFLLHALFGWSISVDRQAVVASAAILLLAAINIAGTHYGGRVQNWTTILKIGFVIFLSILPFLSPYRTAVIQPPLWPAASETGIWLGLGAALAGIMWAYDGWGNVSVVAEEIRNPSRSIPWALTGGVLLIIVLYTAVNFGYHITLPWQTIADHPVTGLAVADALLPRYGDKLMWVVLVISMFGALNANILAGPRVLFAMARDKLFLPGFGELHARYRTPAVAIAGLSIWSVALIVLSLVVQRTPDWLGWETSSAGGGSVPMGLRKQLYDVLTDYCIFGGSMFYLLAVAAVFVMRYRRPTAERPYRTWGYPFVPALFVVSYIFLLGSMFYASPRESLGAMGFIAAGLIVYEVRMRALRGREDG